MPLPFSSTLDIRANDWLAISGTSYTQGNSTTADGKWYVPAAKTLRATFTSRGINNTGMNVQGVPAALCSRAPLWIMGGLQADTIALATAAFAARVGSKNPTGLIIELGENDSAATIASNGPAMIAAVKNPANYAAGRVTPRWCVWLATMWRGDEKWSPPDPLIVARNDAIQALLVGGNADIAYIGDAYTLWRNEAPTRNPGNAALGFYTPDGSHPTGPGGPQGNLGQEVISRGFLSRFTIVTA